MFYGETERFRLSVISIVEWYHTGKNCSPVQKKNVHIYIQYKCLLTQYNNEINEISYV